MTQGKLKIGAAVGEPKSRDNILAKLRQSLDRNGTDTQARDAVAHRLERHQRGPQLARTQIPTAAQRALFDDMARELSATVVHVADTAAVPGAVADYLKAGNLPQRIRMAPALESQGLPWDGQPLLEVTSGPARADDQTSVTGAFAAIAETGTLLLHSDSDTPTTLNFLPENHIVVLQASQIVGAYEDAWDRLRQIFGPGALPRTVNFITGPSRTADIEQTIQLGAHGPRRLHIVVVDDGA